MTPLAAISLVFRILYWPVGWLTSTVAMLLSSVWAALSFFLLPFAHFGYAILRVLSSPFSVKWRDRFEAIYVFLTIAALTGGCAGVLVFILHRTLSSMLQIDAAIVPTTAEKRQTAAEYRAARREKKKKKDEELHHTLTPSPIVLRKVAGPRRRGLLSQAIMEEEDSDF